MAKERRIQPGPVQLFDLHARPEFVDADAVAQRPHLLRRRHHLHRRRRARVERAQAGDALERMKQPREAAVTDDVAREVAS